MVLSAKQLVYDSIREAMDVDLTDSEGIKSEYLSFEALDIDSLEKVQILILIEEKSGKNMDEKKLLHIRTIEDLIRMVEEQLEHG